MARSKSRATRIVKLFEQDLSNYAQIRRGLSPAMRERTLTKTELKKKSSAFVQRYIEQLNAWRTSSQATKIRYAKAQKKPKTGLEKMLQKIIDDGYFEGEEEAQIRRAMMRLEMADEKSKAAAIKNSFDLLSRTKNGAFYTESKSYWKAKKYVDDKSWDASKATDDMLRAVMSSYDLDDDTIATAATELLTREGGDGSGFGSEQAENRAQLLALSELVDSYLA